MAGDQPIRILIAALGGEGGGVLAGWITEAALGAGLWAQRTSVPGVAQRTGATTYYIEVAPRTGAARPVLALNPAPGRVDIMLSTELLETARAISAGFVTPDRTFLIASTHRAYTVAERSAMADGRLDQDRLFDTAKRFARQSVLADITAVAKEAGSQANAVLLGALAAAGALPVLAEAFRQAIKAEGKAVEGNLRGFDAGLRLVPVERPASEHPAPWSPTTSATAAIEAEARNLLPAAAAPFVLEGVRRLVDYQDADYARAYLRRLAPFVGRPGADPEFLGELARHLAVRMSVEDTIRVAQLKLRESRLARVEGEARARPGDIVHVTEYLKPGPEEILGLLPGRLAEPLLSLVERRGWSGASWPMRVRTTSLSGFLRFKALAALRRWRPSSWRFAREQLWIERWLDLVSRALAVDPPAAREIVETARLVRGYGETYRRGETNWAAIADEVVEPMLRGALPRERFADAVLQARLAALADPEGEHLSAVIASIRRLGSPPIGIAAE